MRTTTLKINSATFGCRPVFVSQEEYRKDPSLVKWFYTKNENGANQLLTNKSEDEHLWEFVEDYIELNPDIIFNEKSEAESSEEEIKKESCRFTAFSALLTLRNAAALQTTLQRFWRMQKYLQTISIPGRNNVQGV